MIRTRRQHENIKMRLRLQGSSLAVVARELAVTRTTVTAVSQGRCRSQRIEAAIATKLGVTPEQLWPERYRTTPGEAVMT
jgi:lambda repressor-like predicted transcriptional regulator